ncbi:MAG: O-antigen ligase family protein [Candidatus Omnitrophota bacterium]
MSVIAIFSYLIALYIRPQDWLPSMYGFPLVDIVGSVALIIAFVNLPQQKRPIVSAQLFFIIFYLAMVFLSNLFTGHADAATPQLIDYFKRTAIFFILIFSIRDTGQLRKVISFIILLSVILAIQVILHNLYGISVYGQTTTKDNRVSWIGAWDGPNVLCLLFVIAIALSFGFITHPYSMLVRIANVIFIAIMMYGVYLTNSRGGVLGLLAVIVTFLWNKFMYQKRLSAKILWGVAVVFAILIVLNFGPSRMNELNSTEESAHERTWIWERGYNLFRENPVFGIGKGQFQEVYHEVGHNNFVQTMVEMGVPGLFIYTALIYLSLKWLRIVSKNSLEKIKDKKLISLSEALFSSMVGYVVTTYFITMELAILFLWFGLCAATINIARGETGNGFFRFSFKDIGIVCVTMVAIVFSIYLVAIKEII